MKKLVLLVTLFSISLSFSQSADINQSSGGDYNTTFSGDYNKGGMWIPGGIKKNEITGSSYLFSNWNGNYFINTVNGQQRQLFNLNYNIRSKKIESFISKDSVFQYDLSQFDFITKNNIKYKVINNGQLQGLFQEVAIGSKLSIYKEATVSIQEAVTNPLTQQAIGDDVYIIKYVYHFYSNGNYVTKKLNKKNILEFSNDKKELVKEFASANNLDFSKDDDVNKILTYYNSL
jgi:hypothetical protein